ncbi:MAG: hypothetical protein ABSF34_10025 [Verrucomicrobiota bacterium]|jgi:hypothetical protein
MGLSQIVAGISALVTALVPMSCQHKAPPTQASPPPSAAAVTATNATNSTTVNNSLPGDSTIHDLGEVALTNHYERCIQLGGGKECILLPKLVDSKNAELTVTYESRTPAGQIHDMIIAQVDAKVGEPTEVTLGDFQMTLKPDISSE